MRVLVLATRYAGPGGVESSTRMYAQALAASGARVDVVSLLAAPPHLPRRAADTARDGGISVTQGGARSTPAAQLQFLLKALRADRRHDIVFCAHLAVAPVARILAVLFRMPYIVVGHGIEIWGRVGARREAALRGAARVVAVSHFTARMIASVHGVPLDRISVIHHAVDPVLLDQAAGAETPPPRDNVTLLTVARLSAQERYKACDAVITALPAVLRDAGSPVRYVLVGDGDDLPRLEALARARGVAAAVTFAGAIPCDGMAARYRDCDIFVLPSITERRADGWAGEGFGIVYLEAAAFGKPVIAGAGGGAPEAVDDGVTGILVDGRDLGAVTSAIVRLVRDPETRARMGEAGRQRVLREFTFERFRREVEAVVESTVRAAAR